MSKIQPLANMPSLNVLGYNKSLMYSLLMTPKICMICHVVRKPYIRFLVSPKMFKEDIFARSYIFVIQCPSLDFS